MNEIILECPHCQNCFDINVWLEQFSLSNQLFSYWSNKELNFPEFESNKKIYEYLLKEEARMDCPECEEVCCIEDLMEV